MLQELTIISKWCLQKFEEIDKDKICELLRVLTPPNQFLDVGKFLQMSTPQKWNCAKGGVREVFYLLALFLFVEITFKWKTKSILEERRLLGPLCVIYGREHNKIIEL